MKTNYTRLILAVVAAGSLSACQGLFSGSDRTFSSASSLEEVEFAGYFAQRLVEGRQHLLANRPGAAITAFRQASDDAGLRASAYNGMAISFDRLGRADLAQRYFMAAIQLEPDNTRFAGNFIRFAESHANETATQEALALAEGNALTEVGPAIVEQALVSVEEAPRNQGMMQRVSDREVRIVRLEQAHDVPAREVRVVRADQAPVVAERTSSPRVTWTGSGRTSEGSAAARSQYPIRVAFTERGRSLVGKSARKEAAQTEAQPRKLTRATTREYPIRVDLDRS